MKMSRLSMRAAALLLAAAGGGCGKSVWITQYPPFYTPQLKSVAVVAFGNQTGQPGAGRLVARRLAEALAANGTYQVRDLTAQPSPPPGEGIRLGDVQAVVSGAVTRYSVASNVEWREEVVGEKERRRHRSRRVVRRRTYRHITHEARVAARVRLVRTSDGAVLYTTPAPVAAQASSAGSPPLKDGPACAAEAAGEVVAGLLQRLVPVRRQVRLDPRKALRLARECDGQWDFTNDFRADEERMVVVVALPAACDRNTFRVAIYAKGGREALASRQLTWKRSQVQVALPFSPRQLAAGGRAEDYEVRFSSGGEVVMKRGFEIE